VARHDPWTVFMILALAAVIEVAILLVRWLGSSWYWTQPPHRGRARLDILKERLPQVKPTRFEERRRLLGMSAIPAGADIRAR
jgi:hypothetical protein